MFQFIWKLVYLSCTNDIHYYINHVKQTRVIYTLNSHYISLQLELKLALDM